MGGVPMSGGMLVVTCARDEAEHLPALVASMAAQRRPPDRWVVVDDGSVDATPQLLADAAAELPYLEVLTVRAHRPRSFHAKVDAFAAGVAQGRRTVEPGGPAPSAAPDAGSSSLAEAVDFRFVACIDADTVLPPDFFERVLEAFAADPRLGITGARYLELVRGRLELDLGAADQIVGVAQVFRIETYDAIGGYQRLRLGGEDTMANIDARRHGWRTAVVPGLEVEHRKGDESMGRRQAVVEAVQRGRCDYDVGTLWWFELAKAARRWRERPAPFVTLARLGGYVDAALRRAPRATAPATLAAHRAEQRTRLRHAWAHRRPVALSPR